MEDAQTHSKYSSRIPRWQNYRLDNILWLAGGTAGTKFGLLAPCKDTFHTAPYPVLWCILSCLSFWFMKLPIQSSVPIPFYTHIPQKLPIKGGLRWRLPCGLDTKDYNRSTWAKPQQSDLRAEASIRRAGTESVTEDWRMNFLSCFFTPRGASATSRVWTWLVKPSTQEWAPEISFRIFKLACTVLGPIMAFFKQN